MRSSKQRQRNKQNRNTRPTGGNIINRVFDSSGPEGKVRGTPQQIIEKYLQLHRDAQLAGDRVNAENFAQHAEHYTRMLAEAMRDVERAREEQEQFQRERQQERDRQMEREREQQRERDQQRERQQERAARFRPQEERTPEEAQPAVFHNEPSFLTQPLFPVMVAEPQDDMVPNAGLVDTPEERAPRRDRQRRGPREGNERRAPQPQAAAESSGAERVEPRPNAIVPQAAPPAPVTLEAVTSEAVAPEIVTPVSVAPEAVTPEAVIPDAATPDVSADAAPAQRPRRPRKPRAPRAEVATPDAAE
ncbi:DUF4167 domain-containing protein [Rubellimicrobium rubrum]|uniref:DUF4167 domain-containing protein n=1 Tax=Rubellimicrobium rubrum TaxID=2585369 RepID=A0A5C4N571_9RHOB|nr:DUF4167 domain-containing protein [Rubellimicrobium rubrum]